MVLVVCGGVIIVIFFLDCGMRVGRNFFCINWVFGCGGERRLGYRFRWGVGIWIGFKVLGGGDS